MNIHEIFDENETDENGNKIYGAVVVKVFVSDEGRPFGLTEAIAPSDGSDFKNQMNELMVLSIASSCMDEVIDNVLEGTDAVVTEKYIESKNQTVQ